MSRQRQFGKDLTNTKGPNAPGPSNQDKEELKIDTKKSLRKEQVICPICYSVILEPVTLPCKHNICRPCFDIHIWETSINCPCCRRRLSVWCRKAAKENTIVNLQLQKEIENQFPLQVAAQKEKLELPPEERKLDQVLVEFLADDSPRLPPRQFAKTGEIAKEFNEMLSKHLEDLNRAEESATEAFIAKCVTPEEQETIRKVEENLKIGQGLKQTNEECLGYGVNFIQLRARTVQAGALKSSPVDPKPIKYKVKPSTQSPLRISTGAEAEESEAFIAKFVSPKEQHAIRNLEKSLELGKGLKEKNGECFEDGANIIKLRARPVKAVDLKILPNISKPKKTELEATSCSPISSDPSVLPKIQPSHSRISTNHAAQEPAQDLQHQAEASLDQLSSPCAKHLNAILSEPLQDLHRAEESASEAFIAKFLTPQEKQAIRNLEKNLKLGEGLKEKNEESLGCDRNCVKLRARLVKAEDWKISPNISKPKKSKLKPTSNASMSPEPSVSPETSTSAEPSKAPISANQTDLQPAQDFQHQAQVCPDHLTAPYAKGAEESASEAFIAKCLTRKERQAIRNLEKNLKLGEGLKEKNEECLGRGANFMKLRTGPIQALDLKTSSDISKPKMTKLKATSDSVMPREPSISSKTQPSTSQVRTNEAGEQAPQVSPRKAKLPRRQFNTPSDPVEKADIYTTKRGHLGSLYQVMQDHNYYMPAEPSSSSAKKSKGLTSAASSDDKKKPEEEDYALALQLQKYNGTLYNL